MDKEQKSKGIKKVSKVFGIVSSVFLVVCVAFLLYSTISYSQTGLVNFFGYSFHTILTPSMEPEIKVGDLVIVKRVAFEEINVGDDILFKCQDSSLPIYGQYVVHRVKEINEDTRDFTTYGINNNGNIEEHSVAEGKVVKVSSSLGSVFSFITQGRNILFVVAIFGIVIFGFMEFCSVIANSAKLKAEKDKEKLNADEELKEKLKKEIEQEIASEKKDSCAGGDNP